MFFVILCGSFFISLWFNLIITAYRKHLSFLLTGFIVAILFFLSHQENLDMIHYDSDLFHDIYNTINEHKRHTQCLFECIMCCSSVSLKKITSIAIGHWIFHVSNFLRFFTFFKYGLNSLKYYSSAGNHDEKNKKTTRQIKFWGGHNKTINKTNLATFSM